MTPEVAKQRARFYAKSMLTKDAEVELLRSKPETSEIRIVELTAALNVAVGYLFSLDIRRDGETAGSRVLLHLLELLRGRTE